MNAKKNISWKSNDYTKSSLQLCLQKSKLLLSGCKEKISVFQ
jgi:hypothetical protein